MLPFMDSYYTDSIGVYGSRGGTMHDGYMNHPSSE